LQGQAITIQSSFLLANDTDADSAATRLRVALLTQLPTNGLLVPNSDGSFTYTPADKFYGTDSFKYQADDGTWRDTGILMSPLSNEVTVTITVEKRKK
jgi:hypothetical protein